MSSSTEQPWTVERINAMEHRELCALWRFAPSDHPAIQNFAVMEAFQQRLFDHFGGFTPAISKSIGFGKNPYEH